jgi:hypothetical protein
MLCLHVCCPCLYVCIEGLEVSPHCSPCMHTLNTHGVYACIRFLRNRPPDTLFLSPSLALSFPALTRTGPDCSVQGFGSGGSGGARGSGGSGGSGGARLRVKAHQVALKEAESAPVAPPSSPKTMFDTVLNAAAAQVLAACLCVCVCACVCVISCRGLEEDWHVRSGLSGANRGAEG